MTRQFDAVLPHHEALFFSFYLRSIRQAIHSDWEINEYKALKVTNKLCQICHYFVLFWKP